MLTVANYHYIRENFDTKYPSIFGLHPKDFKNQLSLLKNQGDFVSPNDMVTNNDSILGDSQNFFLITFDDGLKEQYELALPILDEMNVSAVFFANSINSQYKKVSTVHKIHLLRSILASDVLLDKFSKVSLNQLTDSDKNKAQQIYRFDDSNSAILKYWLNFKLKFDVQKEVVDLLFSDYFEENFVYESLYMSDKQLIYLAQKGMLGSHTHSHFPIGLLNEEEIHFELDNCKTYFENLTSSNIDLVSYPYGTPDAATLKVAEIAQKVGYKAGFTTSIGTNTLTENKLLLKRFDCNDLIGGKNYK